MQKQNDITLSLFLMRISVFIVMFMWTLDKFLRPKHASTVYEHFYFTPGFGAGISYAIGAIELIIILAFVAGFKKRISYGLVLLFHTISTASSWSQYFHPFQKMNLLFFAAIPMLAASYFLYRHRDLDTKWSVD